MPGLNLYDVTDGSDGPDAVYAAHSDVGAVRAYRADNGGTDLEADARVTATLIPVDRVLRYVDPDSSTIGEKTAGELAAGAKVGAVLVGGCLVC
jgi:hypothetical protein